MLSEPDLDFTRLTGDAASGGQVEVHGTRRTTTLSVRNPRLLDLSAVLRLVPKVVERVLARTRNVAFSRFPPIRTVALERQLRVDLSHSYIHVSSLRAQGPARCERKRVGDLAGGGAA